MRFLDRDRYSPGHKKNIVQSDLRKEFDSIGTRYIYIILENCCNEKNREYRSADGSTWKLILATIMRYLGKRRGVGGRQPYNSHRCSRTARDVQIRIAIHPLPEILTLALYWFPGSWRVRSADIVTRSFRVGRGGGQPWRRPACPSSVASRTLRMLYLASRRPRASAAPQPPVDSQLIPTVGKFCEILALLELSLRRSISYREAWCIYTYIYIQ